MTTEQDVLVFQEETKEPEIIVPPGQSPSSWHVLVVDDDAEVLQVTRLALKDFTFAGRKLTLHFASSAREAKVLLCSGIKFAVALIDVVMEDDAAGLKLVEWIRQEREENLIRLILRTGQAGQAPESDVILKYDINDYREKSELTSQKFHTLMLCALRSYRDLQSLYRNAKSLEGILNATNQLFSQGSVERFTENALYQLSSLLSQNIAGKRYEINALAATLYDSPVNESARHDKSIHDNRSVVLASIGTYAKLERHDLPDELLQFLSAPEHQDLVQFGGQYFDQNYFVGVYVSRLKHRYLLYLRGFETLSMLDRQLLALFSNSIAISFDTLSSFEEIEATQHEMLHRLCESIENRIQTGTQHTRRVALIARNLAQWCGLDARSVQMLYRAAPLHDVGKVFLPQSILGKREELSDEEWALTKTHARRGHELLNSSGFEVLKAAALMALQHHENWDGTGYPDGLTEGKIHIFSRILALADVLDALLNERVYRDAWSEDSAFAYIEENAGKKFDPGLVRIVLANRAELMAIQAEFPDK